MAAWNRGSPRGGFAKAPGLRPGAAAVGAPPHFGVGALAGYAFCAGARGVGWSVGGAVRKGSSGRGGWRYQALAIFLTYSAVVATDSVDDRARGEERAPGARRLRADGRRLEPSPSRRRVCAGPAPPRTACPRLRTRRPG